MGKKERHTICYKTKFFKKTLQQILSKTLDSKFKKVSYEDIDFSNAYKIVDKEKDLREMMTKEEKKSIAAKRKKLTREIESKIWNCHYGWKGS